MEVSSVGLLLVAALLHALANLFLKQSRDKLAFTWWMLGATCVLGSPCWLLVSNIRLEGWLFILASGALEAMYFYALSRAYTLGDLSQVYPIARGSAPLFIVVWAGIFLRERPSALGLIGVASIVVGIYLINLPRLAEWRQPLLHLRSAATRWALITGLLISAYMVTDKAGVELVDPLIYLYFVLFVTWLFLSPMWFTNERRSALARKYSMVVTSAVARRCDFLAPLCSALWPICLS